MSDPATVRVALLTTQDLTHPDTDMAPLLTALRAAGVAAAPLDWRRPGRAAGAELVVIRSTWDYIGLLEEFLAALDTFDDRLANPAGVVRWNSHKGYLTQLADAGVPIVPTILVRPTASRDERAAALTRFPGAIVVKPAVSAGAHDTLRFDEPAAAAEHLDVVLRSGDALVQPLIDLAADGERSVIFLGGSYSHTVRKSPRSGDFRVQEQFGGSQRPADASPAELAVAAAALAAVPGGGELLYARVDLAGPPDAPLLMELELIEPSLFLDQNESAPGRLADAIAARLTR